MEYKVITGSKQESLVERVNSFLKDGWVLQGGVSVTIVSEEELLFAQAIVKPEKE